MQGDQSGCDPKVSWYEIVDGLANLWLVLVGGVWIWKLSDLANYAAILLCDWVMHMGDQVV